MKLIIVFIYLIFTHLKESDFKKYICIITCVAGGLLPFVATVVENEFLSFYKHEFFVWITFWITVGLYSFKGNERKIKSKLIAISLMLIVLSSEPNQLTFIILETILILDIINCNKKFVRYYTKLYFLKFLILYFIYFKSLYPPSVSIYFLPSMFIFLSVWAILKSTAKGDVVDRFYAMAVLSFTIHFVNLSFGFASIANYFLLGLVCAMQIYKGLEGNEIVPKLNIKNKFLIRFSIYLDLKINNTVDFNYKPSVIKKTKEKESKDYIVTYFTNDITSTVLINLSFLLVAIMFFLYRLQ